MSFHTVMCWITLSASAVMIAAALAQLYGWRRSAFRQTTAFLRNVRHIAANEPAVIPMSEGTEFRAGKRHPPLLHWEYVYRVNDREYVLDDWDDDGGDALPGSVTVYYHCEHPDRAYISGTARDGVILAGALLFLGLLFLVLSLINLL